MKLIDKAAVVEEIEKAIDEPAPSHDTQCPWEDGYWCGLYKAESIIDTLEIKEVDLEEVARHYLLHEHISPLNEVLHHADLKLEMQYHKDIEDAYKAGFELGLKTKKE